MLDDNDIKKLGEVFATKEDVTEFKDEVLTGQDEILEKINTLLQEKTIGDEQDKRKTEVLKIHNDALKRNKILTEEESTKISQSGAF